MKLIPSLALLILPLAISSAYAENLDSFPTFTYSGFGTVALTKTNTDNAEFSRPNQLKGVTTDPKNSVDSNFGFQATAKFNDMFSLTGQGLVRKNVTDDFSAELAWAFAKVKLSDNLSLRAGRIGMPVFMISDYRNVGYANTMIRPPVEMYAQVTLETVNGIDAVYQTSIGDTSISTQVALGRSEYDSSGGYRAKFKNLTGLHIVAENGPFTLRLGRVDTKATAENSADLNAVVDGLRAYAPTPVAPGVTLDMIYGFNAAANQLEVKNTKASFTSVGFGLDWKNIVVQSEYGVRKSKSLSVQDTTAWYTMVGYRIGKFLPYFNHASAQQDSASGFAKFPIPGALFGLTEGANHLASQSPVQTSNTIGLRWDFYKSAALKVQLDRSNFTHQTGSDGTFYNVKPGFTGPVTILAAGVDFVF